MRPDIKEEDVKEIYNRCEEHRRLWNETEIIFNSNYAIGDVSHHQSPKKLIVKLKKNYFIIWREKIFFHANEDQVNKQLAGTIVQKIPQSMNAQRTAKGPISISECCMDGEYIILENTSKRHDVNMTNWVLTHCVGSVRKVSFKFPENFSIKSRQCLKIWASSRSSNACSNGNSNNNTSSCSNGQNMCQLKQAALQALPAPSTNVMPFNGTSTSSSSKSPIQLQQQNGAQKQIVPSNGNHNTNQAVDLDSSSSSTSSTSATFNSPSLSEMNACIESIENELVIYDIENWTCGSQEMFVRLENEFGEEKALYKKTN